VYKIVYALAYALSLLPFRVLYALSDVLYVVLFYVLRYRRSIVRANLSSSFPDRDEAWLRDVERRFYRWFGDYFMESIKLLSISRSELQKRFTVVGAEEVEKCFRNGQNAAAILGHYCNWEWLSCVGIAFPSDRCMGLIYHPLRNKVFDRLFIAIRSSQPNSLTVPKKDILRELLTLKQKDVRSLFGYIADQGPKWENIHLWLPFLNHETPVFTGAERIMRRMNDAVFYVDMARPRRGYYSCTFRLITKDPAAMPEYDITRRFFQLLETSIRRDPAYYLWTHNRWKRTHEEFERHFEVVNGKVVARGD